MIRNLTAAFVLVTGILTVGCGSSSPSSPSSEPPFSQIDLRVGTGADAASGKRLTVHYALWLYDANRPEQKGQLVQTSVGGSPFTFTLGNGSVIKGWDQGVPGMKVGGVRRLVIPSSLAYGSTAQTGIPANSTLVFEIELLDVQG